MISNSGGSPSGSGWARFLGYLHSYLHTFTGITNEESLSKAKEIAEDWYLQLRGKLRAGEIKSEKHLSRGVRAVSTRVRHHHAGATEQALCGRPALAIERHLVPFFGNLGISEITAGKIQEAEFTFIKKRLRNGASHRDTALCIRKS
jgi:hypothetical protein